jgi:hypothetical protein
LFKEQFRNGHAEFRGDEHVLFLCGSNIDEIPFSEAKEYLSVGYGTLIVATDGSRFIAETESEKGHPYEIYAGS